MMALENARSPAAEAVAERGVPARWLLRHSHDEKGQLPEDSGALVAMINDRKQPEPSISRDRWFESTALQQGGVSLRFASRVTRIPVLARDVR